MDNQGEDFPGGPPPGRNNNVRGGTGLPNNIFSPGLRSIDPQYAAALDFEELRMRHQLEVQQDMELRRRLVEEQQHQLLSELEYRNKIQQLQELQELQAHQQHQQGLSQLLAQNPHLLEMHQQQQYHSGRENSLLSLSSLRDDFLLQRHQLMLQDQMQQQLQEQMSRDSQQHEQEELFAMLQASRNLRGALPADVSSLRQEEAMLQQPSNEPSPDQKKPSHRESIPAQLEVLLNNANGRRAESTSTDQGRAYSQNDMGSVMTERGRAYSQTEVGSVTNDRGRDYSETDVGSVRNDKGRAISQTDLGSVANGQECAFSSVTNDQGRAFSPTDADSDKTDKGRAYSQTNVDSITTAQGNNQTDAGPITTGQGQAYFKSDKGSVTTDQGRVNSQTDVGSVTNDQEHVYSQTDVGSGTTGQGRDVGSGTTGPGCAYSPTDVGRGAKKRSLSESIDINGKDAPQDPPMAKKKKSIDEPPQINPSSSKDATSKAENVVEDRAAKNKELDMKVAKLLESQKLPAQKLPDKKKKDKAAPEKKVRKKKSKTENTLVKNGGKRKKAPVSKNVSNNGNENRSKNASNNIGNSVSNNNSKKDSHEDDGSQLSDHEQSVIDFLGSRGSMNGKLKKIKVKRPDQIGAKQKSEGVKEVNGRNDDEGAHIILNFKRVGVSSNEVQNAKKWNKQNQTRTATYPVVPPEKIHFLTPGLKFNLPSLPVEPELTDDLELLNITPLTNGELASTDAAGVTNETSSVTASYASTGVEEDIERSAVRFIGKQKRIFKPKESGKGQDEWWPSNACIRKERRKLGVRQDEEDTDEEATGDSLPDISFVAAGVEATKERLANSVEPGVLEKLPHCKLYDDYWKEKKNGVCPPKFCCQTTETFPFEAMVCCSVCSTWRHAQCGGHYKRYTADSVDPSNVLFRPICDQCYLEEQLGDDNTMATKRIERQRIEHLRRCNATNAVIRQVAFGKHSGQYKWPLGSVSISHISGHTRSVQARHEKAEKQWSEMTTRLGSGQELRPRERQRVRTRELERLLVSIEDAEGDMDRHNMMLFLQNDTSKLHPAGFEIPRRNIFDPEEDLCAQKEQAKSLESLDNRNQDNSHIAKVDSISTLTDASKRNGLDLAGPEGLDTNPLDQNTDIKPDNVTDKDDASKVTKLRTCSRQGCDQKPRFDSIFCSDSCGVSTLEADLLCTLQYAGKLHPSILRS